MLTSPPRPPIPFLTPAPPRPVAEEDGYKSGWDKELRYQLTDADVTHERSMRFRLPRSVCCRGVGGTDAVSTD
jgi:hypothetical protein